MMAGMVLLRRSRGVGVALALVAGTACNCGASTARTGISGPDSGLGGGSGNGGGSSSGGPVFGDGGCAADWTCAKAQANCGPIGDGCTGTLQCGTCTAPETCGGGGKPSVCGGSEGCVPRSCADAGATCGPMSDGCGHLLQCGSCTPPENCGGAGKSYTCGFGEVDGGDLLPDGGCRPLTCAEQKILRPGW